MLVCCLDGLNSCRRGDRINPAERKLPEAVQDNGLIVDDQEPGCLLIKYITHRCAHKMSVSRGL